MRTGAYALRGAGWRLRLGTEKSTGSDLRNWWATWGLSSNEPPKRREMVALFWASTFRLAFPGNTRGERESRTFPASWYSSAPAALENSTILPPTRPKSFSIDLSILFAQAVRRRP